MNAKDLCLELSYSESEDDIVRILKEAGYYDDESFWRLYGDKENNFSTIGNQQSTPDTALVEKIINSVDAVLMNDCLERGIGPSSRKAPSSIKKALEKFYNIYNGELSNISATERTKLAQRIALIASGSKKKPNYTILDSGEGQTPKKMPSTLLSIGESNKIRIPFVQGKFNMGGTGILAFCGEENFELIISKRNQLIAENEDYDDTSHLWGFTIVRRINPKEGFKSSTYKYLVGADKQILTFDADTLPLLPAKDNPFGGKISSGTYIKLYEYKMSGAQKTNILFDLNYRLNLLMPQIALPVRLYERREYRGHSLETNLFGLSVRLEENKQIIEEGFPSSARISVSGQEMGISIYAFKRSIEGKEVELKRYKRNEGVLFNVNGQCHGSLDKRFLKTHCGMTFIGDSMLLMVDCSSLEGRIKEDMFMNNRTQMRDSSYVKDIKNELVAILKNHQGLKELQNQRKRDLLHDKIGDSKPLANAIQNIMKNSPTLSNIFIKGIRLPAPFNLKETVQQIIFEGKDFPTFFTLDKAYTKQNPRLSPKNVKFRIQFKTDANNDYFNRKRDEGQFKLFINHEERGSDYYAINLWNGTATLNIIIPEDYDYNEVLEFKCEISDISRVDKFIEKFYIKVQEDRVKTEVDSPRGKRKPPPSKEKGKDSKNKDSIDIPEPQPVYESQWSNHGFDKNSALKIIHDPEEGKDLYFINVDNIHLNLEKKNSKVDMNILEERYKIGMVLIGIALMYDNSKTGDEVDMNDGIKDVYDRVFETTKILSPILLPMINIADDTSIKLKNQAD